MAKKLILEFPDDVTRMDFINWYLDGNGEQDFGQMLHEHDKPYVYAGPPEGQPKWDWQTKPDADEYVIRIVRP